MRRLAPFVVPAIAAASLLGPGGVSGQAVADLYGPPVAVLEDYRAALFAADWPGAASFVHPDDLEAFRTLVESLDDHPEGPDLLAEWFGSPEALPGLDDTEVMGAYLRWLFAGQPGALELMKSAEWALDDVLVTGDRAVVEATVSIPTDGDPLVVPDTTALRRDGDRWRIDLSAAIEALRESFAEGGGRRR